jgi:hypothetical protein
MPITIQPIERAGQFWINISLDGCALEPRGPFHDANEAAAMGRPARRDLPWDVPSMPAVVGTPALRRARHERR